MSFDDLMPAHAELVGEITMSWNLAQLAVYHLFKSASGMPEPFAEAAFYSLKADSAQRDMTLALCQVAIQDEYGIGLVKRAMKAMGQLAGQRNAFIHSMWTIEGGRIVPARPSPKLEADLDAQGKKLQKELTDVFGRLILAERYFSDPTP